MKDPVVRFAKRTIAFFRAAYNSGYLLLGHNTKNPRVNIDEAFAIATYYRGVKFISDRMVEVPLSIVYKDGMDEAVAKQHYMQRLLENGVGPLYNRNAFVRTVVTHLLSRGAHYSRIRYTHTGVVEALEFLHPWTTSPRIYKGNLVYDVTTDAETGKVATLPGMEVFHTKGLSIDGINGMDPISTCLTSLGLAISSNKYGANFFANDASPSIILHSNPDTVWTEAQRQRVKNKWSLENSQENSRGVALAEGVSHVSQLTIAPNDSQFLETRQEAVRDIARMLGIPPVLLGDPAASTYDNISQLYRAFVTDTLIPLATEITADIDKQLLNPDAKYYARFNFKSALVDAIKDRYVAYSIATGKKPILSVNEVRKMEDLPEVEGGDEVIEIDPEVAATSTGSAQQGFGVDEVDDSADNATQNADIT